MIIVAGPCQIESHAHAFKMAALIREVQDHLGRPIVFKASFDKANRTSGQSARGAGTKIAKQLFRDVWMNFGLRCLTDVHEPWHCEEMADSVAILQIPALLCRQTDLIEAAARSGCDVNIKKGQFMAPTDVQHAVAKARNAGADIIWATERGTSFGYHNVVVDVRGIPVMKASGADAVLFDASHSAQTPAGLGSSSGGNRADMPVLARAAIAAGADGIFVETHDIPELALSDGPVQWPADRLYDFLAPLRDLYDFRKGQD